MENSRIYKYSKIEDVVDLNLDSVFIPADRGDWKKEKALSIKQIGDSIKIEFNEDIKKKNVQSLENNNIEINNTKRPEFLNHVQVTYISVDENYLYVWVPQISKWKRIPLLDWI